jgi:hypothetical protein
LLGRATAGAVREGVTMARATLEPLTQTVRQGIREAGEAVNPFNYRVNANRMGMGFGSLERIGNEATELAESAAKVSDNVARIADNVSESALATESAIQIRINPEIPGRPDPAWSIDTRTFSAGKATANGGIRNNIEFWKQWVQHQPETISPSNAFRIQELELSPRIDKRWIESFPEHADHLNETLIHHHVDQGVYAIPVPASTHIGFSPPWH